MLKTLKMFTRRCISEQFDVYGSTFNGFMFMIHEGVKQLRKNAEERVTEGEPVTSMTEKTEPLAT